MSFPDLRPFSGAKGAKSGRAQTRWSVPRGFRAGVSTWPVGVPWRARSRKRLHARTVLFMRIIHCLAALCLAVAPTVAAQSVRIEVDASRSLGPLQPVWSFFGYDEPNYTYMKDGQKLLSELAALSPVTVYVRTHNLLTTGDGTAALKWGSTNAYTEDANGNAGLRLDDRRPHLRHLYRAQDEAAGRDRLHARSAVDQAAALPARVGTGSALREHLYRLGLSAQRLREVGRARVPVGAALRCALRRTTKPRAGIGKSGTSQTSATGRARPRSITSSTTTPRTR